MDPSQKALCFNNYFHSTFTNASLPLLHCHHYQHLPHLLTILFSLRKKYIKDLIELDPTKAKGCDQFYTQ